jgi:predicted ATPase
LVFTDIVGSTGLWLEHESAMSKVLEQHDALVADCVARAGGRVFKHTGDGAASVFGDPVDALEAAAAIQRAIASVNWELPSPLMVRAAAHSGVVHERDGDLFGPPLNRAARLVDQCAPGGVLISEATARLLAGRLPAELELVSLGSVQLRGLQEPEVVLALTGPGLSAQHDVGARRPLMGSLPAVDSDLVGRLDDVQSLTKALTASALVTVVGVGGMGKTRLALEVATLEAERFIDGVWWCDLTTATHGDAVGAVVLDGLRTRQVAGRTAVQSVTDILAGAQSLLVLDNCEHVIDAVRSLVATVRAECADVSVLMTSREALGLHGEALVAVSSLPVDDSIELFCERAAEVRPDFVRDDATSASVRAVCERLDGIPLAIELAAARCRAMSVAEISQRLGDRFKLLRGGRGNIDRHRTLQAAVAWSHSLLDDEERDVFDRMAVFAGGAALDAIATVVDRDEYDVLDVLDRLVARSMVVVGDTALGSRYRMLETLRQFAEDQLMERGIVDDVHDAYLGWIVQLAEEGRGAWMTDRELACMRRHCAELDNIRAALAYALDSGRVDDAALVLTGFGETAVLCGWYDLNTWADAGAFDVARNDDHVDAIAFLSQLALFGGDAERATQYLELVAHVPDEDASLDLVAARSYAMLWVARDVDGSLALLERWDRSNARTVRNPSRARVAHAFFTLQAIGSTAQSVADLDAAVIDAARLAGVAEVDEARAARCDIWTALLIAQLANVCLAVGDINAARDYATECMRLVDVFPEIALLRDTASATFAAVLMASGVSGPDPGALLLYVRDALAAAIAHGGWFAALVLALAAIPALQGRPECDDLVLCALVGSRTFPGIQPAESLDGLVGADRLAELAIEAGGMNLIEATRRALAALEQAIGTEG